MKFYAKSKQKSLLPSEHEKIKQCISDFISSIGDELQCWEKQVLERYIESPQYISYETAKTLKEHLDDTYRCAQQFFKCYGNRFSEKEKALIYIACKNHDLGKANIVFQARVNDELYKYIEDVDKLKKVPQINHGYLSAVTLSKKDIEGKYSNFEKYDWSVLITSIYHHHTRDDNYKAGDISDYCKKYYNEYIKEFINNEAWELKIANINKLLFRNNETEVYPIIEPKVWRLYLTVKGMLNKFDWSVSAGYEDSETNIYSDNEKLEFVIKKGINKSLRPVQKYMDENKDSNLVVIAPTGSGKTEAALLWIGNEKGFYTLPLKVSSNAIYNRIEKVYGYKYVSLLHSDSFQQYLMKYSNELEENGYEKYERAKLLSSPLTICTVDQLFKFVYKALGTEVFAATLKYSKLVLDEIQAYSSRVVATIIYGLKTIQQMGGKFAIITATFPPVLKHFMDKYGLTEEEEYKFKDFSYKSSLERHIVCIKQDFNFDDIISKGKEHKVLVICNTVSKAQEVYEKLSSELENVYLLHSRFIRCHREILESRIIEFSDNRYSKGIWVTTQIVEASLDIDFDILYTEMCTCDSLLQRMGRCNRSGRYYPSEANIIVYANGNGVGDRNVYNTILYERSLELLKQYEGLIFKEAMKTEYINQVYNVDEVKDTKYYKEIEAYLEHFSALNPLEYKKEEADKQFRMIESIKVIPESIYIKQKETFELCLNIISKPHMKRDIKMILKSKLDSMTLSVNLYGRYPKNVDRSPIKGTAQIHRANLQYDFDNDSCKGKGLIMEKQYEESYFL